MWPYIIILFKEAAVEKLQALVLIPDLSRTPCSLLDLSAITRLSRLWLSCQMSILLLPCPEGGQMSVHAGRVASTPLPRWLQSQA